MLTMNAQFTTANTRQPIATGSTMTPHTAIVDDMAPGWFSHASVHVGKRAAP